MGTRASSTFVPLSETELTAEELAHRHGRTWTRNTPPSERLSLSERHFLADRDQMTTRALEAYTGLSLTRGGGAVSQASASAPPGRAFRIGVAFSGGGVRALIFAAGVQQALEQMGLWDCVTYQSGVSGGAWWMLLRQHWGSSTTTTATATEPSRPSNVNSHRVFETLSPQLLQRPPLLHSVTNPAVRSAMSRSATSRPKDSFIDLYGALMACQWLAAGGLDTSSRLARAMNRGHDAVAGPLPIYTCVSPSKQSATTTMTTTTTTATTAAEYDWVEATPFEVSNVDRGEAYLLARELLLYQWIGMVGSAPCASVGEVEDLGFWDVERTGGIQKPCWARTARFCSDYLCCCVCNRNTRAVSPPALYGPRGQPFNVVDAGVTVNAPLPSLFREERVLDLVLVFDARSGESTARESHQVLRSFQSYASARGYNWDPDELLLEVNHERREQEQPSVGLSLSKSMAHCIGQQSFTYIDSNRSAMAASPMVSYQHQKRLALRFKFNAVPAPSSARVSQWTPSTGRGHCPAVIYVPLHANKAFHKDFDPGRSCSFLQFKYSHHESSLLYGLSLFNLIEVQSMLRNCVVQQVQQWLREYE